MVHLCQVWLEFEPELGALKSKASSLICRCKIIKAMPSAIMVLVISLTTTYQLSEKKRKTITAAVIARHANKMRNKGFNKAILFILSKRIIIHWKGKTKANAVAEK